MERRRVGQAITAAGLALVVVSGVGYATGGGEKRPDAALASATPTTAPPSTSTAPAPSTTAPVSAQAVRDFFAAWASATSSGDVEFLVSRLHPAVIGVYGEAQCRAYLGRVTGGAITVEVRSIGDPAPATLDVDGIDTAVGEVHPVEIFRSDLGRVVTARVAALDGDLRWFSDCGDPQATP